MPSTRAHHHRHAAAGSTAPGWRAPPSCSRARCCRTRRTPRRTEAEPGHRGPVPPRRPAHAQHQRDGSRQRTPTPKRRAASVNGSALADQIARRHRRRGAARGTRRSRRPRRAARSWRLRLPQAAGHAMCRGAASNYPGGNHGRAKAFRPAAPVARAAGPVAARPGRPADVSQRHVSFLESGAPHPAARWCCAWRRRSTCRCGSRTRSFWPPATPRSGARAGSGHRSSPASAARSTTCWPSRSPIRPSSSTGAGTCCAPNAGGRRLVGSSPVRRWRWPVPAAPSTSPTRWSRPTGCAR